MAGSKKSGRGGSKGSRSRASDWDDLEYEDIEMEGGARRGCRGLACASSATRARVSRSGGKAQHDCRGRACGSSASRSGSKKSGSKKSTAKKSESKSGSKKSGSKKSGSKKSGSKKGNKSRSSSRSRRY